MLDFVHDKCVDAAETLYNRRLSEIPVEPEDPKPLPVLQNDEPKENQMVIMFSTSKINVCFLQAATLESESQKKMQMDLDFVAESGAVPTVSLLAGSISGISAKFLSVRRKPVQNVAEKDNEMESRGSPSLSKAAKDSRSPSLEDGETCRKGPRHRNTMTTGSVKCSDIQLQLRRLCEVDDVKNSITTAIPEEEAQAKFQINSSKQMWFTENFSTEQMETGKTVSLLMLECGLDNLIFQGGTERGSGNEIWPKVKAKREAASRESARRGFPKAELLKGECTPPPQGFSNPLFARDTTGSVAINIDLPYSESQSCVSSISSSLSSFRSSSDGNISDIESDSDLEAAKPLLKSSKKTKSTPGTGISKVKDTPPEMDAEVARRTDVTVHFSNIWFNLASPSSVKTVPSNFHLYNSLVTTVVPVVTAWVAPIENLQSLLSSVLKARQHFINSVVACLLAQALPEHGRIPKAVSVQRRWDVY